MSVVCSGSLGIKDHVGIPAYLHGEKREEEEEEEVVKRRNGFFLEEEEAASSESSSIGDPSSSASSLGGGGGDEEEGEEEVQSKEEEKKESFGSLDSLEESLPIKRGLSNYFSGKAKSFASLSDAAATATAKDLAKAENPFNKRRRILLACSRRASYSSLLTVASLPPLFSPENAVEEGEDEEEDEKIGNLPRLSKSSLRSPLPTRSYSLSDLQDHHHNQTLFKK